MKGDEHSRKIEEGEKDEALAMALIVLNYSADSKVEGALEHFFFLCVRKMEIHSMHYHNVHMYRVSSNAL